MAYRLFWSRPSDLNRRPFDYESRLRCGIYISFTKALDFSTLLGRAMAGMRSTFAEFERDIIRERVIAGIANARANGRPHGRPRTAALKREEILRLKKSRLNHSQISRKLKISRGSVINQVRG
ncbi:MAG: hypothetical protein DMF62_06810 [Acidobacteria bacterium]|nr:MAG: hypothetical protein DMF62_06810 [Acidobacteriota bacterium]